MTNDTAVLIGMAGGDHVLLTNWHCRPDDWIKADAEVQCGTWRGQLTIEFYGRSMLLTFAEQVKQLYRELRGTATLAATEPRLNLTLTGNGRGTVTVEGDAQSDFVNDTKLHFQFVMDQTFLPPIADGISSVVNTKG